MNRRLPQRIARFWTVAVLLAPAHAAPQEAPAIAAGDLPASFVQAVDLEALLPQSSVYDILEDREGFLWFATREGVARWDGREVRTWRHDPLTPGSLPGNIVRSLRQDRSGDVWAVAYDYLQVPAGIARIRAPGFTVVERMGFAGATVALSARGEPVLVGADSLWRFDPRTSSFQPWMPRAAPAASGADDQTPSRTLLDRSGQLWLADEGGLERCRLEPPEGCVALPFGEGVLALAGGPLLQTRDGTVWLGTASGVALWAPDAHPAQDAPTLLTLGVAPASLAEDSAGVVWVLSNDGVDRVEAGRVRARSSLPVLGTRSELAPVVLHVDRAQNVWVGTVWGVFMHARAHKPFHHLEHVPDDPRSLGSGLVTALAEAPGGAVWVGTIGGGLNRWDRRTGVVRHFRAAPGDPGALPSDVIWDLAVDARGVLWVATSEGLGRFVPETGRFRVYRRVAPPPPPTLEGSPNSIPDLQPDRSGRVWTSCATPCADTLAWFDGDAETFRLVPVPGLSQMGYLKEDPDGRLWMGARSGIEVLDPGSGARERIEDLSGSLDGVLVFHFSPGGDVWVGANSGLYRVGADRSLRARYTTADGLPSDAVYGILEDERRRLWLSTNRGLAVLDPDEPEGERIRAYDRSTGLVNVEFNRNAYLEAADGTLFFGGDRGVTWFHPRDIRDNPYAPPVVVTAFERATESGSTREPLGAGASLRVRPSEYTFAFEYAALSFVNPHRNRYVIMLDGFDTQWRDVGTATRATYTSVPPGTYTFRVRGANEDGVWGLEEAQVPLVVEPWVWQTVWFRATVLAGLGSVIAGVTVLLARARYRVQLARARAEQALERERARLSRDMHDEVGASLTEIAILSDVAAAEGGSGGVERIGRIGAKAREALDAIGEIIWAIDPVNDGGRTAAFLREHAGDVLDAAGLEAELDFPPSGVVPALSAESRRTLLLVLKEALANVLRHAGAGRVRVRLAVDSSTVRLEIEDDGRGLPPGPPPAPGSGHDGLRNMHARAAAAGGTLTVDAAPTGGTRITLRVPVVEVEP